MKYLRYTGTLATDTTRVEDFLKDVKYYNNKFPILEETTKKWTIEAKHNIGGCWDIPKVDYNKKVFKPCNEYEINIDLDDSLFEI